MRSLRSLLLRSATVLLAILVLAGCVRSPASGTPSPDRSILTRAQFEDEHFETAYDVIAALRANWLLDHGPDSFSNPSKVLVYLDNVQLGTVETLKTVTTRIVYSMEHMNGVAANARYGIGHSAGVIVVSTYPAGAGRQDLSVQYATNGNVVIENAPDAADGFVLAHEGTVAPIYVSATDYVGVARAAGDLRADVERVTGSAPVLNTTGMPASGRAVLVGTIGHSTLIDGLVRDGKLDTKGIAGKWETFVRQVVRDPMPGVSEALVIAGSDKRGTIYGIYDLSSSIGVSPWYWWADVPVRTQRNLTIAAGRHTLGEPAVKYRGIFINDEAPAFSGWTKEKFGGFNHGVYEHMFELILRLKGNYLWPAMWGSAFADDDTTNARLADEYGIVMGTSHHEPMTRAQAEWKKYGKGAWNYDQNDSTLRAFWRGGIERMGTRENIVTLGMRGDGDMPMTQGSNIALLERIVADQRKILGDVTGKPVSSIPQDWALYKEVQDYYDKGMRVPDDVTLLFADDNWGNIRRLPKLDERSRPGGFGVYYHFDYVGGPRNYKWINTNPVARVWEQMHMAHEYGADRIWVVNVGDLKPMEWPIDFFLDYAWNPDRIPAARLPEYTRQWAERQFGAAQGAAIAEVMTRTLVLAGRRKPELLAPETYSLTNYREADRVVAEYAALRKDAERIGALLGPTYKDAYFELVLHPVLAAANLNELYVVTAKNRLYALQGRNTTNLLADSVRRLFDRDAEISRMYNHDLAGGKWSHMMDQTHIGYTIWQEPPRNMMPRVDVIQVPAAGEMGVAVEGFEPRRGPPTGPPAPPALPVIDSYQRQSYAVDLFDRGAAPFTYAVTASDPWLLVSPASGTVSGEQRLDVSVDWSKAPMGQHRGTLAITTPGGRPFTVEVPVANHGAAARAQLLGFVEGNGVVSMEAEHFTSVVSPAPVTWQRIPDFGRTLSGMTPMPVTAPSRQPTGDSPRLEYRMTLFDSGTVSVKSFLSPLFNVHARPEGVRFAVSFDDETPQVVNVTADTTQNTWNQNVAENIVIMTTRHELAHPGVHTLKYWMVDPGVVVQKIVVDAGGMRPSYLGPPESFYRTAPVAGLSTIGGR
jgi:hypothetical protein